MSEQINNPSVKTDRGIFLFYFEKFLSSDLTAFAAIGNESAKAQMPEMSFAIIIGKVYAPLVSLYAIVNARCPPKVNAAEIANAELIIVPRRSISLSHSKVGVLETIVVSNPIVLVSLTLSFLPSRARGFFSSFDTIYIKGNAPESTIAAFTQTIPPSLSGAR